jgi:hypothetical protein
VTYPDTFAIDRWTTPGRGAARDWIEDWSRGWFDDPLERVMLVLVVLASACLLLVLATRQDAGAATAQDACVLTAVEEARAFAQVLGDDRLVPVAFAERACARS